MKRIISFVLLAVLTLSLAACSSSKGAVFVDIGPSEAPVTAEPPAPVPDAVPEETPAVFYPQATHTLTPEAGIPANAHVASSAELKAIAEAFIGRDVAELIEAVGQPLSVTYGPSGEDGELTYNGFTVYTRKADGVETVDSVL